MYNYPFPHTLNVEIVKEENLTATTKDGFWESI